MNDDDTRGMDLPEAVARLRRDLALCRETFKVKAGEDAQRYLTLAQKYDLARQALAERDAENERLRADLECPSCGSIGSMWRAVTLAWGPPISTLRELYPGLTRALDDVASRLPQLRETDWSRR